MLSLRVSLLFVDLLLRVGRMLGFAWTWLFGSLVVVKNLKDKMSEQMMIQSNYRLCESRPSASNNAIMTRWRRRRVFQENKTDLRQMSRSIGL